MAASNGFLNSRNIFFSALGLLILIWTVFLTLTTSPETATQTSRPVLPVLGEDLESSILPSSTKPPIAFAASGFAVPTSTKKPPPPKVTEAPPKDRPLVLYSYFESENARANLKFYLDHALHDAADFLFLINGPTDAEKLLPNKGNIRFIKRPNDCYDLGGFAEMLLTNDLYKNYQKFIMMNASVRGPFLPIWSNQCWSDIYLDRLTNKTKLIGMTMNCRAPLPHVQSMLWAVDRVGMEILLHPSPELVTAFNKALPPYNPGQPVPPIKVPGINSCPHNYWEAVSVEVHASYLLKIAGYRAEALMYAYHGFGDPLERGEEVDLGGGPVAQETWRDGASYEDICWETLDPLYEGHYWGMTIHPWDTVFTKQNRPVNKLVIDRLSQWADGIQYSSYDYCH